MNNLSRSLILIGMLLSIIRFIVAYGFMGDPLKRSIIDSLIIFIVFGIISLGVAWQEQTRKK
jgi:hypothetical protein